MALLDRRLFGLLGFVGVGIALPSLPACSDDEKSGIMLAISTDMLAPKDVNAVGVTVSTDGKIKFNVVGRVTPEGEVLLPATLAIAEPDDPNATIGIRVVAFQSNKARVMRDVQTSIPKGGRIALLRIPLNFANDGSVNGTLPDGVLPAPLTTSSLGSSMLSPRDFGTSTGYDPTVFAPNCPVANQTWVAGQCVDSYVAWSSLPTYTPGSVGRADDTATCFDTYGCFAGSTVIPESGDDGVVLDRASCSLVLHGADPSTLNVAFLTATTGACIQSGSCYVPLDHGAAGWTESGGRIQLPAYACRLTPTSAALVLAPASTTCGAKTEARAACATPTSVDAGVAETALVSAEDFVPSIALEVGPTSSTLFSAGSARTVRIDTGTRVATLLATQAEKKAYRFGRANVGALLTDGTDVGAVLSATALPSVVRLLIGGAGLDATDTAFGRLWATTKVLFSGFGNEAVFTTSEVNNPSALTHVAGRFITGNTVGRVQSCELTSLTGNGGMSCYPNVAPVSTTPIESLSEDFTSRGVGVWALAQDGLYYVTVDDTAQSLTSKLVFGATFPRVTDGSLALRRSLIAAGRCAIFTSELGVEWMGQDQKGGVVVRASSAPILGVTADASTVYYSVYAAASEGGGIYRAPLPDACK